MLMMRYRGIHVDGSDMDVVSFDDSEQFEEGDSVCSSWLSDTDQVSYWSGWKQTDINERENNQKEVFSLMELCAKCVAMNYAFEVVEQNVPPIPVALQLRIAFWSFPESEEEIRLYSFLACGSNEMFKQGCSFANSNHVTEVFQIGFHLSGIVIQCHCNVGPECVGKQRYNVSLTFDRGHITSCSCSCSEAAMWCEHAIALCIHRIVNKNDVSLRAPISESLAHLEKEQLLKFAQYLISELPQQIRLAQQLLDELLMSKKSNINLLDGAPDPTAGAAIMDDAKWVLDESSLRENIKKILARCFGALPLVVVDVNSAFLTSAPPVSLEWSNFIRSFQGHEPEAMWNLLSIVQHMFARCDRNAALLLNFITEECLLCYQMMFYWLSSYNSLQGNGKSKSKSDNSHGPLHPNSDISRHVSAHLMEEVIHLWELAVMTPFMSSSEKAKLKAKFESWDKQIVIAAKKGQGQGVASHPPVRVAENFLGFTPAIQACDIDWDIYYEILHISDGFLKEPSFRARSIKLDELSPSTSERVYQEISTLIPPDMDEYVLATKLTHSLCCHGFVNKASKLASELARKIICGYPERIARGELNFSSIAEKADSLCNILLKCPGNERIVFEIAILGLTVPRFPAATNMEEVKLSYLEMALYQKLTNIMVTEEHLAFIRFQGRKFLANPMMRGDAVLPLIIGTYIFEVLCNEHVESNVLQGKSIQYATSKLPQEEDKLLGYQCALVSLRLCSSTVDQKQPMLCESIRHHRRDLALALLTHCKCDEKKIDEVIRVILDEERHGFMRSKQPNQNAVRFNGRDEGKKKKSSNEDVSHTQDDKLEMKYGFSFGGVGSGGGKAKHVNKHMHNLKSQRRLSGEVSERGGPSNHPRRYERASKVSSDSDSGHGEGDKRLIARNLSVPLNTNRKSQQQRRQFRQSSNSKSRGEKASRSDRTSTWVKHKSSRVRKTSKSKTSRELTESDSGQEMHYSFEAEASAMPATEKWRDEDNPKLRSCVPDKVKEDWADEVVAHNSMSAMDGGRADRGVEYSSSYPFLQTDIPKAEEENGNMNRVRASGSRWSISSPDDVAVDNYSESLRDHSHDTVSGNIHNDNSKPAEMGVRRNSKNNDSDFNIAMIPLPDSPLPLPDGNIDNEPTSDLGYDDDFNIETDMFHATLVEKIPSVDGSPNLSEVDEYLASDGNDGTALVGAFTPSAILSDTGTANNVTTVTGDFQNDDAELIASSPDMEKTSPPAHAKYLISQPLLTEADPCAGFDVIENEVIVSRRDSSGHASPLYHLGNPVLPSGTAEVVHDGNENDIAVVNESEQQDIVNPCIPHAASSDTYEGVFIGDKSRVSTENVSEPSNEKFVQLHDLRAAIKTVCVDKVIIGSCPLDEAPPLLTQSAGPSKPKKKPKKNKKSRTKISFNMQSIEAEAYSLFELAKSVLVQARNNNTFSADVDEVITNNTVNKRLQLAAFEIGLFALNIHNYSSPNWFSRTYSSYVSWIENQAVEIGSAAIRCLNERWEGVLTPSESVQIATRASRSGDSVMRRNAAELALSCLPHSQSLSRVDITHTITLCKEQHTVMLERACSAVENAGRNGGVQPELLFLIAREWHYLHEESQKMTSGAQQDNMHGRNVRINFVSNFNNRSEDPVYMTHEQFVQEQMHQQAQEMLGRQLPRNVGVDQFTWIYPQYYGPMHHCPVPQQPIHVRRIPSNDSYALPIPNFPDELNISEIPRYLQNSYRVGIHALEALTLRMADERPDVKFALAPPSSDDIRWMCALSASLGPSYLKIFCKIVYNAVTSPYLLHDLALEAARHFALYNPAQLASHLRSPSVSPIVQKALAMYTELVHYELCFLGTSGYPDFVELLRKTRSAFCMAPGGMARFNDILEVVRKAYPKKRELRQLIMNGLSKA